MDRIDSLANEFFTADAPGGAIGLIVDGELRYAKGFGLANLEAQSAFTPATVFRACSISKQFVCLLVLQLAREGKLALDAHLSAYLPALKDFSPDLTLRHLSQNRSGLRDYWCAAMLTGARAESHYSLEDGSRLIRRLAAPMFAPGAQYSYSNGNWRILEWIIEAVTGRTLPDLLIERFFAPLGMRDTGWGVDTGNPLPGDARGYRRVGTGWKRENTHACWSGDAALLTTLDDFMKWEAAMLRTGKGALPGADQLGTAMPHADGSTGSYAFGINAWRDGARWMHWHSGALRGWRMVQMRFPQDRAAIVVMINRTENPMPIALKVAECVGLKTTWDEVAPVTLPDRPILTGVYFSDALGLAAELHDSGGQVSLDLGGESVPLIWTGPATLANASGFYRVRIGAQGDIEIHARQFGWRDLFRRLPPGDDCQRMAGLRFCSDLLESAIEFSPDGTAVRMTGPAGTSDEYTVRPLAPDFLAFDCLRALDELPPGRFTIRILDSAHALEIGCFMARGLIFRRT